MGVAALNGPAPLQRATASLEAALEPTLEPAPFSPQSAPPRRQSAPERPPSARDAPEPLEHPAPNAAPGPTGLDSLHPSVSGIGQQVSGVFSRRKLPPAPEPSPDRRRAIGSGHAADAGAPAAG